MYQHGPGTAAGAGAVGGGLAMTGTAADLLWMFLSGFALLALALALWRMAPRKQD